MKTLLLFISILTIVTLTSFSLPAHQVCIEIKDRQHLPVEIYDELKDYKAILLGEMHGTNEAPEYAEGMINLWLGEKRKVIVGLEISGNEQAIIDSFISGGDFSIIQKMPFFNQHIKYGTSSKAVAYLIKTCYGKPDVKIVCLDITNYRKTNNKDSMMAICINNTLKLNPGCMLIALTGNIHNKLDSNQFVIPMGYWLYNMPGAILTRNEIASLDVVFDTGTAWCCQPDCGVHNEPGCCPWIRDNCNYDNLFRVYNNRNIFLFTKTITASWPLNP